MSQITCHNCHAKQPLDYQTGDRCTDCGDTVKETVNCGWCTHLVPNQKFCRDCGFEMLEAPLFGVVRMLKNSGIDKLSLPQKVRELPPDIIGHYKTLYNKHYAALLNQIEQIRLCEEYLLHKQYSFEFEQSYLAKIPFDEETLALLSKGPNGNFTKRPDRLPEIIQETPLQMTGWFATIAGVYALQTNKEYEANRFLQLEQLLLKSEINNNPMLLNVIAAMAHWTNLPYLWENGQFPTLKGKWNLQLFDFVIQQWPQLSAQAKERIAPIVGRLKSFAELSPLLQTEIKKYLEIAAHASDKNLQFAAAATIPDGNLLFRFAENKEQITQAHLAVKIITAFNLPQQTVQLLLHKEEDLQLIAFGELTGQQRMNIENSPLSETISKGLLQYLQNDSKQTYRNQAIEILGKQPQYAMEVARIAQQQTGVSNNPDLLLQTLKNTRDAAVIAQLTDQLVQFYLNKTILQAIANKVRGVTLSEFAIQKIIDFANAPDFDVSCQFIIPNILRPQLQLKNEASFYTLRGILQRIFIQESDIIYKMARNLFFGKINTEFIYPAQNEVLAFEINKPQIMWFFGDVADFIPAFAKKITIADTADLNWYYNAFWKPYEAQNWLAILQEYPQEKITILNAWVYVTNNATLPGTYRGYAIKALKAMIPILEKREIIHVQEQMAQVMMPEGDMHYLLEQWQKI